MSKRVQKLIKRTRHALTWGVVETHEAGALQITSDHAKCMHTINIPPGPLREIEYLHELANATLCETVNPLFSTQYFALGEIDDYRHHLTPACQAASDWFADQWLIYRCPAEERAEIAEHLGLVLRALRKEPGGTPEALCGFSMIIAQAIKYCGYKANLGQLLGQAVGVFLAVEPSRPTVAKLQAMVNGLLACYCPLQVELIQENGLDMWAVKKA